MKLFQLEEVQAGVYKMVQLYIDGEPYLYFGDADTYARDIMTNILARHELKHEVVRLRHGIGPASAGERYFACGMGAATCTTAAGPYIFGEKGKEYGETKLITLSGYSIDYGLSVDEKHLDLIKEKYPDVGFLVTDYK